jgi:hypothetical protein
MPAITTASVNVEGLVPHGWRQSLDFSVVGEVGHDSLLH